MQSEIIRQFGGIHQQVFMLFFAIFWGATYNVQPRWKAFQFPLIFKQGLRWNVLRRVCLAVSVLTILPIVYFGYILYSTSQPGRGPVSGDAGHIVVAKILVQGVLPALGMFGIYRLWIGIIEWKPDRFYKHKPCEVPEKYRHVEPTYRWTSKDQRCPSEPVVDLGKDAAKGNFVAALVYLVMGSILPWLPYPW